MLLKKREETHSLSMLFPLMFRGLKETFSSTKSSTIHGSEKAHSTTQAKQRKLLICLQKRVTHTNLTVHSGSRLSSSAVTRTSFFVVQTVSSHISFPILHTIIISLSQEVLTERLTFSVQTITVMCPDSRVLSRLSVLTLQESK